MFREFDHSDNVTDGHCPAEDAQPLMLMKIGILALYPYDIGRLSAFV
ncbi:hypothetical protein SAMN05421690_100122 [Nitrosomonas sp. Nm51]|nr:hypothetical protein [Nitrosomonas sp. Nm51]SEQ74855.1 hypothetical protein SAMN05421690_100122 [Nitrosomonas sp. Nm51]